MDLKEIFGLRDNDEGIALIVVLLAAIVLGWFVLRDGSAERVVAPIEPAATAIVATEVDSANVDAAVDENAADVDGDAELVAVADDDAAASADADVVKPELALSGTEFAFGPIALAGVASPNSNVQIMANGGQIAETRADARGDWEIELPTGELPPGRNALAVRADGKTSQPIAVTVADIPTPQFNRDYNVVTNPGIYQVGGTGTPDHQVALCLSGCNDPASVPLYQMIDTDRNGQWNAKLDLMTPATYEMRVFAVDSTGDVVMDDSSEPVIITVTEDGAESLGDQSAVDSDQLVSAADDADASASTGVTDESADAGASGDDMSVDADADASANADEATDADTAVAVDQSTEESAADSADADGSAAASAGDESAEIAAPAQSFMAQLEADGNFTILLDAIERTGLMQTFEQQSEPLTLLAPSDAVFQSLPAGTLDAYLNNDDEMRQLLVQHVVPGSLTAEDLKLFASADPPALTNLANSTLSLSIDEEVVTIGSATVTRFDILVSNGYMHEVDTLVVPTEVGLVQPIIDDSGVPTFEGDVLTVVGMAQSNSVLTLMYNSIQFGTTVADQSGNWSITGDIAPGDYKLVAYSLSPDGFIRGISAPVYLTVYN